MLTRTCLCASHCCFSLLILLLSCFQGVGLANTLFGLIACVTFLSVLHVIRRSHRRSRASDGGGRSSRAGSGYEFGSGSGGGGGGTTGSGGFGSFFARRPLQPSTSESRLTFGGGGGGSSSPFGVAAPFSSYVKFLRVSAAWALLWVLFNIVPQVSNGRDLGTLVWHAIVATLVYAASVFLELAVVVFLLQRGVGQKAFRTSALVCGVISLLYAGVSLILRIAKDLPPAHRFNDYPLAQLDFINSPSTNLFLAFTSGAFATFFFVTSLWVALRQPTSPVAGLTARRRPRHRRTALGAKVTTPAGAGATEPLISSDMGETTPGVLATTTTTLLVAPSTPIASYGTSEGSISPPSKSKPIVSSASIAPNEVRLTLAEEGATKVVVESDAPASSSPTRSTSPTLPRPSVPRRRSVVFYSLFLALYYTLKTIGVTLLYFDEDTGICFLDGGILLYMCVYAFLLYWTLVQDSRYWHDILDAVSVGHEELVDGDTVDSAAVKVSDGGPRLTENSGSTAAASRLASNNVGGTSIDPRRQQTSVPARHLRGMSTASASTSSSVPLRDYLLAQSQLVLLRSFIMPESAPTRANLPPPSASHRSLVSPSLSRRNSGSLGMSSAASRAAAAAALSGFFQAHSSGSSSSGFLGRRCELFLARIGGEATNTPAAAAAAGGASSNGDGSSSDASGGVAASGVNGAATGALCVVKQFTLPHLTADFLRRDFAHFLALVPMGAWLAAPTATQHPNLAAVRGICVDPPCVSLIVEYGARGTLYDMLYSSHASESMHAASGGPGAPSAATARPTGASTTDSSYQYLGGGGSGGGGASSVPDPSLAPTRLTRTSSSGSGSSNNAASLALLRVLQVARQVSRAMGHLHRWSAYESHALHLSPCAVTLTEACDALVCDLETPHVGPSRRRVVNLPAWAAPEVLAGGPTTRAANVYSFAVLLWCMLTRAYPCVLVPSEHVAAATAGGEVSRSASNSTSRSGSFISLSAAASGGSLLSPHHAHGQTRVLTPTPLASSLSPAPIIDGRRTSRITPLGSSSPGGATNNILKSSRGGLTSATGTVPAGNERDALLAPPSQPPPLTTTVAASSSLGGAFSDLPSPRPLSPSYTSGSSDSDVDDFDGAGVRGGSLAGSSEEEDDLEDIDSEEPPPVCYVRVPLNDLKVCQRLVLTSNARPPIPRSCPPAVARLLEQCWDENPEDRPTFDLVTEYLELNCQELDATPLPLPLHQPEPREGTDISYSDMYAV